MERNSRAACHACGVAVTTSALHADDPKFDTWKAQLWFCVSFRFSVSEEVIYKPKK